MGVGSDDLIVFVVVVVVVVGWVGTGFFLEISTEC